MIRRVSSGFKSMSLRPGKASWLEVTTGCGVSSDRLHTKSKCTDSCLIKAWQGHFHQPQPHVTTSALQWTGWAFCLAGLFLLPHSRVLLRRFHKEPYPCAGCRCLCTFRPLPPPLRLHPLTSPKLMMLLSCRLSSVNKPSFSSHLTHTFML